MKFTSLLTAALIAAGSTAVFAGEGEKCPPPPPQENRRMGGERGPRGPMMPPEERKAMQEIRELARKYRETKDAKVLTELKAKLAARYNATLAKMKQRVADLEKKGETAFVDEQVKRMTADRPQKKGHKGGPRGDKRPDAKN